MTKLTREEAEWISNALTTMIRDESSAETQTVIGLTYEYFPKEVADNMLALARAAAAGQELAETIQSEVTVRNPPPTLSPGGKHDRRL